MFTLCWVKETRPKSVYTVWLHLCEVLGQAKLIYGDRNQITGCLGQGWGVTAKRHQGSFWIFLKMLSLLIDRIVVYISLTHQTLHFPSDILLYVNYNLNKWFFYSTFLKALTLILAKWVWKQSAQILSVGFDSGIPAFILMKSSVWLAGRE